MQVVNFVLMKSIYITAIVEKAEKIMKTTPPMFTFWLGPVPALGSYCPDQLEASYLD